MSCLRSTIMEFVVQSHMSKITVLKSMQMKISEEHSTTELCKAVLWDHNVTV